MEHPFGEMLGFYWRSLKLSILLLGETRGNLPHTNKASNDYQAEGEKKATVVVSPLVRVSAHVRDIEDKIDYQAVGKMQKELEKLHLMTENESYQKNAPETVKEDNR